MIDCAQVLARLWEYLDGETPPGEMETLRAHLEICRRCYPAWRFDGAYLELLARQRNSLAGAPPRLAHRVRAILVE